VKLGPQPAMPWTYLDSPAVTQTLRSCDCEGPEQIDISKADRVVRVQDASEDLRSAEPLQLPHTRQENLSDAVMNRNSKCSGSKHLSSFECSDQTDRVLCEKRQQEPLLATMLRLSIFPGPCMIS